MHEGPGEAGSVRERSGRARGSRGGGGWGVLKDTHFCQRQELLMGSRQCMPCGNVSPEVPQFPVFYDKKKDVEIFI